MSHGIEPHDVHNRTLLERVHPPDWENPRPRERYDLVVIGAGSAGLITASLAAGLGATVALVERGLLGGDCLNTGCVPSKALIRAARLVADAGRAAPLGAPGLDPVDADFAAALDRVRSLRARISAEDSARRYRDELGVEVFLGSARFTGPDAVDVDGASLRFKRAVVATGGRPTAPPIDGLEAAGYLTHETVFELRERPQRLGVIGAGPIGCELAQALCRLGCRVTLLDVAPRVLPREDRDAAAIVQERLAAEGVRLVLDCKIERVAARGASRALHVVTAEGSAEEIEVDALLVAAGRAANVEGLGLEAAGVEFDAGRGVRVDDHLRTANPRIYAAGDVCMEWKFTHAADAAAKIVVQNALFAIGPFGRKRVSDLVMPWCTYTEPEVAHVGITESDALERGDAVQTFRVPLEEVNRAVLDGEDDGFVKVHVKRGSDRILGATVVAAHAGELISELTLAMTNGLGLGAILQTIHPYPTVSEGLKRAAGLWVRGRLTPLAKRVLRLLLLAKR